MKGKKIIQLFREGVINDVPDAVNKIQFLAAEAQMKMFDIHGRAIGCLCECLGMNAENMWAAIANQNPVFLRIHYHEIMQKWELVNEKGEPTI